MKKKCLMYFSLMILFGCNYNTPDIYDIEERTFINADNSIKIIDSIIYQYVYINDSNFFIYKDIYTNQETNMKKYHYESLYCISRMQDKVYIASTSYDSIFFFNLYFKLDSLKKYDYDIAPFCIGSLELIDISDSTYTFWGNECSLSFMFDAYYLLDKTLRVDSIYNDFITLKLKETKKYKSKNLARHKDQPLNFNKLKIFDRSPYEILY